jgi:Rrf2 family iron-sulfur cluster assembly transcriptional regulator
MKISAQEEYGLRILLRIARDKPEDGLTIADLSVAEGLSASYAAKITRILRLNGFIESTRGKVGGYVLAQTPENIVINKVLKALGGALFDQEFCEMHTGALKLCTNSIDCSVRSLWRIIQLTLDNLLEKVTLKDLMDSEMDASHILSRMMETRLKSLEERFTPGN